MSSESEDFQSADEGSDEDDPFCSSKSASSIKATQLDVKDNLLMNVTETDLKTSTQKEKIYMNPLSLNASVDDLKISQKATKVSSSLSKDKKTEEEHLQPDSENSPNTDNICESEEKPSNLEDSGKAFVSPQDQSKTSEPNEKSRLKSNIKESKIGLKKPRDRLGDRLGAKKLGVRQTNPLEGLSHENFKIKDSSSEVEEEKEKLKRQRQWEDQQEIWTNADIKPLENTSDGWSSWGGWGSTLITAASTLTREVSRGVETVMETVEGNLGAPDPRVLAEEAVQREKETIQERKVSENLKTSPEESTLDEKDPGEAAKNPSLFGLNSFGLGSLVSNVSGALKNASNKVLLGGLDTLELIGRKTMDVLQEGDPRLEKKRLLITQGRPNLSKILEEARLQNSSKEPTPDISLTHESGMKSVSLLQIWDATEGPAHLEALLLVAKQRQGRSNTLSQALSTGINDKAQQTINKIKACSDLDSDFIVDDFSKELEEICSKIFLPLQSSKVISAWVSFQSFVEKLSLESPTRSEIKVDIFLMERDLLTATAGLLSQVVGFMHKAAEVALITVDIDPLIEAMQFQKLCSCISYGLEKMSDSVCERLASEPSDDSSLTDTFIPNIYLQMAEGNDLLKQSLKQLMLVFMQIQTKEFT